MITGRTPKDIKPKAALKLVALLIAVGGVVYLAFSTSYTRQKGPRYTGESGDSLQSFRLCNVDSVDRLSIAEDGKRLDILCRENGRWVLCSKVNGWYHDVTLGTYSDTINLDPAITLSPDSTRIGIVSQRASQWRDSLPRPVHSDNGGQWFVMIDRHVFGGFDRDYKPVVRFSPDSRKYGFPFKKLGQYYVQVVDTTFGPYDCADMTITRDGEIVLGYVKQDRAYIERVYSPERRTDRSP